MKFLLKFICAAFLVLFFVSCSDKKSSNDLFNLSPQDWYSQIIMDIRSSELKKADAHFTSFSSEHINSPLLEPVMLILAQAHINEEEYVLANFYLDQYIRKFGTPQKIEFAQYLKIKANFDSFTKPNRNGQLIDESIASIELFLYQYPNTIYRPLLETMRTKFKLAKYYLDKQIYDLYSRLDRNVSAEIYKDKLDISPLKDAKIIDPKLPWYMRIFE